MDSHSQSNVHAQHRISRYLVLERLHAVTEANLFMWGLQVVQTNDTALQVP
jgi:hypothetical protein